MSSRIYTVILLLAPLFSSAQVVSNGGRFSVGFDRGCVPFEINVTELDSFGNITRQYFYEDGATATTSTSYTYNSAGTFRIVQVVGIDVIPKTDTLFVEAIDPTLTQFSVEKCNLNGINITSEEDTYDFIRVYFTSTDSVTLNNGESASFNYGSNATQTFQTKGFYNGGNGNCSTFSHNVDPLPGLTTPTILSASVKETCRDFFALSLEISDFDPQILYEVEFQQANTTTIFQGNISSTELVFSGINYDRNSGEYCVAINALDRCTSGKENGTQFCVTTSELSSTPFENLYTSYTANGVFINMDSVTSGELQVYRKLGEDGAFELRTTVLSATTDTFGSLARRYFYRIDYVDSCGETLFSAETNPPLISFRRLDENEYEITTTEAANLLSTITSSNYEIGNEEIDTQPIPGSIFNINLDPVNGTRQFLQTILTYDDGTELRSNQLTFKYKPIIHVPSAFTPNGDGMNDTLELFGLPTQNATTRIYTKWGQLIYTSSEPSPGWDGFISGSLAPEGVYLYEVTFEDSDGVMVNQKGTFALIKK